MGSKLSCIYRPDSVVVVDSAATPAPARVIAADGSLRELVASPCVAVVSDVLGGGDDAAAFFVCNSDASTSTTTRHRWLPASRSGRGSCTSSCPRAKVMFGRPLSNADMVRLAVRASVALSGEKPQRVQEPRRHRRGGGKKKKKVQVMPALAEGGDNDVDVDGVINEKLNEQTLGVFTVFLSPASGAAAAASAARSPLKRALSLVEEEA
ncbi:hypothetical protein E2562_035747 [Oryza meyeriana var. granulata]|uniref:Uncharacterized protein n=1 Tax=Oryza meyeriana var. granulata TaxID=110450 RepID=A0A6G1FFN9_9ORYZ|nr:hypothetical protein E2562_035747 [Oryza meyeriana var. granulata]